MTTMAATNFSETIKNALNYYKDKAQNDGTIIPRYAQLLKEINYFDTLVSIIERANDQRKEELANMYMEEKSHEA